MATVTRTTKTLTIPDVEDEVKQTVMALAKQLNISVAKLLRVLLDVYLKQHRIEMQVAQSVEASSAESEHMEVESILTPHSDKHVKNETIQNFLPTVDHSSDLVVNGKVCGICKLEKVEAKTEDVHAAGPDVEVLPPDNQSSSVDDGNGELPPVVNVAAGKHLKEEDEQPMFDDVDIQRQLVEMLRKYQNPEGNTGTDDVMKGSGNEENPNSVEVIEDGINSVCASQMSLSDGTAIPHCMDIKPDLLNSFKCPFCDEVFSCLAAVNEHSTTEHNTATMHACDTCGKRFITNSDLQKHKHIHDGENPFQCSICGECFDSSTRLSTHIHTHGEPKCIQYKQYKQYECLTCGMKCVSVRALKLHQHIHNGEKPHECTICGKVFSASYKLSNHKRTHKTDPVNGNCSSNLNTPTVNKLSHTGEKPYACVKCSKSFRSPSELTTHALIHTGVKPYSCAICQKGFVCRTGLYRHRLIHTGEKAHKCKACGRCFSRLYSLTRHIRTHSGEKSFDCWICGLSFTQSSDLTNHTESHEANRM